MKSRSLLDYRKDPRVVFGAPLLIITVTSLIYYVIQRGRELTTEALSSRLLLFVLWNINLILILGIVFVLLRGIVKVLLERQRGILGARFRSKLVATYLVTSLLPIALLFFVATDLLRVSIDRWFNTPVSSLLENSEAIAQELQDRAADQAGKAAGEVASIVARGGAASLDEALTHVRTHHQVDLVGAYDSGVILRLQADPKIPIHEISEPPSRFFEDVLTNGYARKIDVVDSGKWIRYAVRIGTEGEQVAIAGILLPNSLSRMLDENIVAYANFRQLNSQRAVLKASQTSLFLTVTLSILFGVLWTAIFVSRRITVPVQALAEGTQTLARGEYSHRIGVKATDEFGVLIDSFNGMASQLEAQRDALTDSNVELQGANQRIDEERAYLSTVLESVSTGILAFSEDLRLLSVNQAALRMLQIHEPPPLATLEVTFPAELAILGGHLTERPTEGRTRELTLIRGGELRYFEISVAPLKGSGGRGGWVMAIEDLTELVQAQKLAAWSEAARRIAHEIKNPLTPIQLSAERIAKKFRNGDPDTGTAIAEGCETIVSEVGQLKRLVDEFSRFARMPAIDLKQTAVAEIFEEVARLYRDVKPGVSLTVRCDPSTRVILDPQQIRRALINLIDNAIEATDLGEILLSATAQEHSLVITVDDPGRGIPDADKEKLFLPYFSTKREGTGLGLAIVHRIVHDHDGRISVHDKAPHGTRFEIEIPA